jgi:hypothetical protein
MEFEDLIVEHPYYCSDSNYYSRDVACRYNKFKDFLIDWEDADLDYNHCFRFDIKQKENDLGDMLDEYFGEIFFMLQRKGIFTPCLIENIYQEDEKSIIKFLTPHWEYTKKIWEPFSK